MFTIRIKFVEFVIQSECFAKMKPELTEQSASRHNDTPNAKWQHFRTVIKKRRCGRILSHLIRIHCDEARVKIKSTWQNDIYAWICQRCLVGVLNLWHHSSANGKEKSTAELLLMPKAVDVMMTWLKVWKRKEKKWENETRWCWQIICFLSKFVCGWHVDVSLDA